MDTPIRSVGIIMDGNRRWAKARGLHPWEGHRAGAETLEKIAQSAQDLKGEYGLECVTLYTFSTENWDRPKEEIDFLMDLIREKFPTFKNTLGKRGIRVRIVGQRERFPADIQQIFTTLEAETAANTDFTVVFALSYGGRAEIVAGVNKLLEEGKSSVDEAAFAQSLWTALIPDPDIIIRTSGEMRTSGFLTWGAVYAELFFSDTLWPDFTVDEFKKIFDEFRARERRHGK